MTTLVGDSPGPQALPSLLDIKIDTTYEGSYFETRGVSKDVAQQFQLGHLAEAPNTLPSSVLGSPAMPLHNINGDLSGWIFRPDHPDFKYYYWGVQISKHLFGLAFAMPEILEKDEVILVEGPFDVLVAHSYGYKNVVAVMGSDLSVLQVLLLASVTTNFKFTLDSDSAGLKGITRSEKVIARVFPAINTDKFILYPHKDFCDYVLAELECQ